MRYFRRAGPDVVVFDSEQHQRFVRGPQPPSKESPDGSPGETIAYDDRDKRETRMVEQCVNDPGWYEVDARGAPVVVEPLAAGFIPPDRPPTGGGIVTERTLAMIGGEDGPEVVIPLDDPETEETA